MVLVIGLVVGLILGAGATFILLQGSLRAGQAALQQRDRRLAQLEQEHEHRLRDATARLQQDYQQQAQREQLALRQRYEAQIQALETATPAPASVAADWRLPYEERIASLEAALAAAQAATPAPAVALEQPAMTASTASVTQPSVSQRVVSPSRRSPLPTADAATMAIAIAMEDAGIEAIPALTRYSHHADPFVRQRVAENLGQLAGGRAHTGSKAAISTLIHLSQDPHPGVRKSAVIALGQIQSAAVIPPLRRSLRDPDLAIVAVASTALEQFKGYGKPTAPKTQGKAKAKAQGKAKSKTPDFPRNP